mgnify:CR=1 FL=1
MANNDKTSENSNEKPKKEITKISLAKPNIFAAVEDMINALIGLLICQVN